MTIRSVSPVHTSSLPPLRLSLAAAIVVALPVLPSASFASPTTVTAGQTLYVGAGGLYHAACDTVTINNSGTLDLSAGGTLNAVSTLTIDAGGELKGGSGEILKLAQWVNHGTVSSLPATIQLTTDCGAISVSGTGDTDGDGKTDDVEGVNPLLDSDADGTLNWLDYNKAPVDGDETLAATVGSAFTPVDLLANATDADSDTLGISGVSIAGAYQDAVSVSAAGVLSVDTDHASLSALPSGGSSVVTISYSVTDPSDEASASVATLTLTGSAAPALQIRPKAVLQGAYRSSSAMMGDEVRAAGYLPLQEPYTALGMPHDSPAADTTLGVLAVTGDDAVVDWVLVELRDSASAALIERHPALLQRDGDIVAVDGTSPVTFGQPAGDYRVGLRHRNHLGVVTAAAVTLSSTPLTLDFSDSATPVAGTHGRLLPSGKPAMLWAGDINQDNQIVAAGTGIDLNRIMQAIFLAPGNTDTLQLNFVSTGYQPADINFDGKVIFSGAGNDANLVLGNVLLNPGNTGLQYNYIVQGGGLP